MVKYYCDLCGKEIVYNEFKVDFEIIGNGQEDNKYHFHIGCGKEAKDLFEKSVAEAIEKHKAVSEK